MRLGTSNRFYIYSACSSRLALLLQLLTQGCSRLGLVAGSSSRRLVVARIARESYAACNINFALLFPPQNPARDWSPAGNRIVDRRTSLVHVSKNRTVRNPDHLRSSSRNYAVRRTSTPRDLKEPSRISYLGHLHLLLPFGAVLRWSASNFYSYIRRHGDPINFANVNR